ncbi:DUF445 domain-containing protein [Cohnella faecalis]|uniref:DUF445 domain-containing protein n=1 Tax=Cohnella faecalis TaxID=2315694 RepID=A0A398CNV2_9BACL|nr:DUF445 domain-containing protein [Cohnella faecalis]RIE04022.1 DUF445 domain-containing protein [Cohnella faecalis]
MKKTANLVLLLVALAFGAAVLCKAWWPDQWWSTLLFYMSEAGLVGGLADWFAVTALFRRPLGLPLKHAAIIPNNRLKLIDGAVQMVETQLLPPNVMKESIEKYSFVRMAVERLDPLVRDGTVYRIGWKALLSWFESMDRPATAAMLDKLLRQGLRTVPVTPYAGKSLSALIDSGLLEKGFDRLLDEIAIKADSEDVKQGIRSMLETEKQRKLNEGGWLSRLFKQTAVSFAESADILNLDEAASIVQRDLLAFLEDMHRPDHEMRTFLLDRLRRLADSLNDDPDIAKAIESWKETTLERTEFSKAIEDLLGRTAQALADGEAERMKEWLERLITRYWDVFKDNASMQNAMERHVKSFLSDVVDREHRLIGTVVRETLDSFTKDKLNEFVESKVGRDLSRIRINGSVLGAFIGACMYVILHVVYDPILRAFGVS